MRDGYITIKSGSEGAATATSVPGRVRRGRRRRSRVSSGHHLRRIRMHGCARCGQISRPASRTLTRPPGTRSTRAARLSCVTRSSRRSRRTGCVGAAHRLATRADHAARRTRARRRGARLHKGALLRRIRVRFLVGAGLRAARPRLLPEARARRAVHAGERRRACWCGPGLDAAKMRSALIAAIREFAEARAVSRRSTDCSSPSAIATRSRTTAGSRATTCSSTGTTTATVISTTTSKVSPPKSARRPGANAAASPKTASPSKPC